MKKALITGIAALFLATSASAGYFGNEKWTENDRYCVVEKLTAPRTPGSEGGYLEWGEKNLLLMDLKDVLELQKFIPALKRCEAFQQCVAERDGYTEPKGKKPKHCYENGRRK